MGTSLLLADNREALEGTSRLFTSVLKDENDDPIPAGSLTTLTLTLYDKDSGDILNSRNDVNVLNANGGVVDGDGNFTFTFTHQDNVIHGSTPIGAREKHVALFEWTYAAGARYGKFEFEYEVRNLNKVP